MKRVFVLAVLPLVLSALETVNLIKDAGFEKDSDLWLMRSEAEGEYDSTVINRHDLDSAFAGEYCGSIDTRTKPSDVLPSMYGVTGQLYQVIEYSKRLGDLDSVELLHMAIFSQEGDKNSTNGYGLKLAFSNPTDQSRFEARYFWLDPSATPAPDTPTEKFFPDTICAEGEWSILERDLNSDLILIKGLSPEIELDSLELYGYGIFFGFWQGQKVFFDGIRLTGYADYDVGVKYLLSPDSIGTREALGESLRNSPVADYIPMASIKNFGREDAPEFSVIAEIFEGTTRVYYDSLPWSLTSDTEDTVTFAAFTPTNAANHTLVVRTSMSPDESDEDDALSKTLYGSGIAEPVTQPSSLQLEVSSLSTIRYSLPPSEHGTITLYNPTGRIVERLQVQGKGQVNLRPGLASGVYFVKLEAGKVSVTKKTIVLR